MWTKLPVAVTEALERLRGQGFSAFLVGGCVRDLLRGVTPQDYDMTTSATPEETKAAFADKTVVETGIRHGTVTVFSRHMPLEITTFRRDGVYTDGRHPDGVSFATDVREDLSRRDFTVNAMAWSPWEGLVDLFGGREDLRAGVIRCVGEPSRRFSEDALRILRGVRFASRLGFAIEEQTALAMRECTPLLAQVSRERICDEFVRLLQGQGVEKVLAEFSTVVDFLMPELSPCTRETARLVASVPPVPALRLAAFFYGRADAHRAEKALTGLRMEKKLIRTVSVLLAESASLVLPMEDAAALRLLQRVSAETAELLLTLAEGIASVIDSSCISIEQVAKTKEQLCRLLASSPCLSVSELAIKGSDLLALGCPGGEAVGKLLRTLLEEITEGKLTNDPASLTNRSKKLLKESAHTVLESD